LPEKEPEKEFQEHLKDLCPVYVYVNSRLKCEESKKNTTFWEKE
jgi:hypothetical protein